MVCRCAYLATLPVIRRSSRLSKDDHRILLHQVSTKASGNVLCAGICFDFVSTKGSGNVLWVCVYLDFVLSAKERGLMFFGWVFFLVSFVSPHVLRARMWAFHTCGEPNEIEWTAAYRSCYRILLHQGCANLRGQYPATDVCGDGVDYAAGIIGFEEELKTTLLQKDESSAEVQRRLDYVANKKRPQASRALGRRCTRGARVGLGHQEAATGGV